MLAAMKIAFIGLGRMGMGMARNLLRAGHTVAVYNRSREKAEALAADGARVASSPADACRDAEAVLTMVADDRAVEEIVFGNDGIAAAMKNGLHSRFAQHDQYCAGPQIDRRTCSAEPGLSQRARLRPPGKRGSQEFGGGGRRAN